MAFRIGKSPRKRETMVRRGKVVSLPKPIPRTKRSDFRENETQAATFFDWKNCYRFLWVLFASVLIYVLFFSPFLRVRVLSIDGAESIRSEDISLVIRDRLSKFYFGMLPSDTFLLLSKNQIREDILRRFPKIRSLSVEKKFPDTLRVTVEERDAVVVWCTSSLCWYIDEDGYAYDKVDIDTLDENHLVRIVDESNQSITTDQAFLDQNFVRFTMEIGSRLVSEADIEVLPEYVTSSRFSSELRLKTREGWEIYMSDSYPLDQSIQALQLVLKKSISPERRAKLKYIDVRVASRVYYVVDGESVPAPAEDDVDSGKSEEKAGSQEEDKTQKKDGKEKEGN